jgi:predicted flavoprotein YhiN
VLAGGGARVILYERMPSAGRKFLLAGRGGLNLTHSEEFERLLERYGAAMPRLRAAIEAFSPAALRAWCEGLGQTTFVGSSGRVFPKAFKASPLLRAWSGGLTLRARIKPRHLDRMGHARPLVFDGPQGRVAVHAERTVLVAAPAGRGWAPMAAGSMQ